LEQPIPNKIPYNDYFEYYAPDYELHLTPEPRENMNTDASLEAVRVELLQQLQELQGAPSVQMQEVPPEFELGKEENYAEGTNDGGEEDDIRDGGNGTTSKGHGDGTRRAHPAEFYDGDNDQ
jgi:histone deacetylase 1/2